MATILVIEVDLSTRFSIAVQLEKEGHTVSTAGTVDDALALARSLRPRMVLLGVENPIPHGWSFVRELMKDPELSSAHVIIFSATHDRRVAEGPDGLLEAIRTVCGECTSGGSPSRA